MPRFKRYNRRSESVTPASSSTRTTPKGTVTITSTTPGTSQSEAGGTEASIGKPSIGRTPSMVMVMGAALLVMSQWDTFFKPLVDDLWLPGGINSTSKYSVDYHVILGGVVFIILTGFIAALSEDAAGVMLIMYVAMWLLFIMFAGQKPLTAFFSWFGGGGGKTTSTSPTVSISATAHKT